MGLTLIRGDSAEISFPVYRSGQPWLLPDGWAVRATAKHQITDGDDAAVFIKTSGGGGITAENATVDGGETLVVTIDIEPADTDGLCADGIEADLEFDVQASGDGDVFTLARTQLTVTPDVTRTA